MISRKHWPRAFRLASLLMLVGAMSVSRPASADPFCETCEVQLGLGGTYHFWGTTDGVVLPLTVSWDRNRYEVGVFRMANRQTLSSGNTDEREIDPYWGVSASRRWVLLERGPVRGYFGFGLAYRSQSDVLTATRWDFASQLGLRVNLPHNGSAFEFTLRHWSNGGIRQPNRGQDFATLTFLLEPQYFRTAFLNRGHNIPITRGQASQVDPTGAMR